MNHMISDIEKIRADFPILATNVYGKPLVYLDNAATTQKPQVVIDTLSSYYSTMNANIHRGTHYLSIEATEAYEAARRNIAAFIKASSSSEIIFTRGTTESINLLADTFSRAFIKSGDEILVSEMEHHSNIVPWQLAAEKSGATVKVIPMNDLGELVLDNLDSLLTTKTRIVAVAHVSNALGTIHPIEEIIRKAHEKGIPVFIDGAQAIQHFSVDVQQLDCDFYAFSGHKMYAPMGIGVLYGKEKYLNQLPPYHGGGEMIKTVFFEKTIYNDLPFRFEAGTPNVSGVLGLDAAIQYMLETGMDKIEKIEENLYLYALAKLGEIDGIRFLSRAAHKTSVISFLIGTIHPYDAGTLIDHFGVAIRTGHHCAQPLMDRLKIPGTIRASLAIYNKPSEIDMLCEAIIKVKQMFL
ncbi:MAG: cysteine desulfurase [Bacteroidales bacterium]|nr:cysteine desulfurase [Bacteroidales bacterium]